jgi:hypothetical protein
MRKLTSLLLSFSLLLTVFLSACSPPPPPVTLPPVSLGAWHHSDLRWIGAGDAADPQQDLIAVYARSTGQDLQIRLDILEFRPDFPFDIYLAVDYKDGGENDLPISGSSISPGMICSSLRPRTARSSCCQAHSRRKLNPLLYR